MHRRGRNRLKGIAMTTACTLGLVGGALIGGGNADAKLRFVSTFSSSGQLTQGQNDVNRNVGGGMQYLADYSNSQRTRTSIGPTGLPLVCQWQAWTDTKLPSGQETFSEYSSYQSSCATAKWKDWSSLKGIYDPINSTYGHTYKSQDTGGVWHFVGRVSG